MLKLNYLDYSLEEKLIFVKRVSKTVQGGRIASFSALTIVGNKNGIVGLGYGKSKDVQTAIIKSSNKAKLNLKKISLNNNTILYPIKIKKGNINIFITPAKQGAGLIAGGVLRNLFRLIGIKDIIAKIHGSTCPHMILHVMLKALLQIDSIYKKRFNNEI